MFGGYWELRILLVAGYFLPYSGGYATNVYELARRLVSLNYDVTVLTCNTHRVLPYEVLNGVRVFRLPCWHIFGGTYPVPKPSRMLWRVLREPYDLVHTQTRFFVTSLLGMMLAKIKRIPLVHTERGTRHSVLPNKVMDMISRIYDHTMGALIIKSAKVNIGVSVAACRFAEHIGAKKTIVVYNGINLDGLPPRRRNKSQKVVTYTGRLIWAKGVQDLITVFASVGNGKLQIVGDGNYYHDLENLVCRLSLDGMVVFVGNCSHDRVMDILAGTDVFVNPSYSEGLPTSVMEAMAMGLPVVATDVGGTRELVRDGHNGYLVAPRQPSSLAAAITKAMRNSTEIGENAKRTIREQFNWDAITSQMVEIYRQVV